MKCPNLKTVSVQSEKSNAKLVISFLKNIDFYRLSFPFDVIFYIFNNALHQYCLQLHYVPVSQSHSLQNVVFVYGLIKANHT